MAPKGEIGYSKPFQEDSFKDVITENLPSAENRGSQIIWKYVIMSVPFQIGAVYGGYLFFTQALWTTCLYTMVLILCCGLGITAGAHRLWSHKAYKARLPLQILLLFLNTMAFQFSVITWSRLHRTHHKFTDTDADPYNSTRGFFFSHGGWALMRKHPDVKAKGQTIDTSDLMADPLLRFQHKHYLPMAILCCFVIPTYIATLWGESLWNAFYVCVLFRHIYVTNGTCLVNSVAHMWGYKPYDNNISAVETKPVSFITFGEGFHNYHHTFPWDYKTAELGNYSLNATKFFIDMMAKIGWAYELKTVSEDVIKKRVHRSGDHHVLWGWDDKYMPKECVQKTVITYSEENDGNSNNKESFSIADYLKNLLKTS